MQDIGHMELLEAAKTAAGNWQEWDSFAWFDAPDPRYWTCAELSHRDSEELDLSNASEILEAISAADPEGDDHWETHFSHFLVGYTDGVAVRVYREGTNELYGKGTGAGPLGMPAEDDVTPAFRALWECSCRMATYPVLNEEDLSRREYEGMLEYCEQLDSSREVDHDGYVLEYMRADSVYENFGFADRAARIAFDRFSWSRAEDVREETLLEACVEAGLYLPSSDSIAENIEAWRDDFRALEELVSDYLCGIRTRDELAAGVSSTLTIHNRAS